MPIFFYWFRGENTVRNALFACVMLINGETAGILSLLPLSRYNGRKGEQARYGFYLFYFGHLVLLAAAARLLLNA